ncbi:MAG: C40 family peptidase [Limisphaerales bacterium]
MITNPKEGPPKGGTTNLVTAARSWLGTPFHAHSAIKGAGVDCVHLAAEIYRAAGIIDNFLPPQYSLDGGQHLDVSVIETYLEGLPQFACVWRAWP